MCKRENRKWFICSVFVVVISLAIGMAGVFGGIKKLYNYVLMGLDIDPEVIILNAGNSEESEPQTNADALELSRGLQKSFLRLKGRYLSDDGKSVDYKELRDSEELRTLSKETQKFKFIKLNDLSELERKAFYINLYNVLTIHALVTSEPVKSVLELTLFWKRMAYNVGGFILSLDILEHGLIRGNRAHPSSKKKLIPENSDLLRYALKTLDPRIHFALNCGANSCPAIRIYSADNLDAALDVAAKSFCSNEVSIDVSANTVSVSQILEWYGSDFGSTDREILQRISQFLPNEEKIKLDMILQSEFKIEYKKYDWGLNLSS